MRRTIAAAIGSLAWALLAATPAPAQDWYVQGSPEEGGTDAVGCLPSDGTAQIFTSLCVSVGCEAGEAPRLGLGLQQVALPPETPVRIFVDGQEVAAFVLPVPPGQSGGAVPLAGQEALLDALWTGRVARISLGAIKGWRDYEVRLTGAGAAIDAALAACPAMGETQLPGDPAETSENPAADAIAESEADCDGVVSVEPGFVRQADVDGDGLNDAVLDWGGLRCDGSAFLYCGSGGCRQLVWLAERETGYRLLVQDLIELVELPRPGELLLRFDGGDCDLSGAELCDRRYDVRDGTLRPLD